MDKKEVLEMYKHFRVTDVRDGMDWCGYIHYGTVSHEIKPLWQTKAIGFARTARYIPFEGPAPTVTGDEYTNWSGWYYGNVCTYPWANEIEPGDFVCLDMGGVDVGLMGSNNALGCKHKGMVGLLLSGGGIRDTDEVILEEIPVWMKHTSQPMVQARVRFCDMNNPVAIGGVAVYPGDLVVADNDGVIVVPQKIIYDVYKYAYRELKNDRISRRHQYINAGMKLDETVEIEGI